MELQLLLRALGHVSRMLKTKVMQLAVWQYNLEGFCN